VINYIPIISVMHERSLLDRIGLFDESLSFDEDWDLLIRLAQLSFFYHSDKVTSEVQTKEEWASPGRYRLRLDTARKIYRKYQWMSTSRDVRKARVSILAGFRLMQLLANAKMQALLYMSYGVISSNRHLRRFINRHLRGLEEYCFTLGGPWISALQEH